MIKKWIRVFFDKLGFQIVRKATSVTMDNPFAGYDYDILGNEAVNLTRNYSMMPVINLFTLYEQAVYCEKNELDGHFVECGVWKGGAVGIMAKANLDFGKKRRQLHLFDAFDDICFPNAEIDGKKAVEDMKKYGGKESESDMCGQLEPAKGFYDSFGGNGTIDVCRKLLEKEIHYPAESIHFHKGWFQDTLPSDSETIDKIAILRLDGDWYESIKICLEYLYDKVVFGGIIVIDDYGYYEGCTKAVDEFMAQRNIKSFLSYSSVGCRYFVKNQQ